MNGGDAVSKVFGGGARCAALLGIGSTWIGCSHSTHPDAANEPVSSEQVAPHVPAVRSERGFAVVELFTSEGCSSCPPADRTLSRLAERTRAQALPVFPLSFHVDYWKYLVLRDRFSSADSSKRQQGY